MPVLIAVSFGAFGLIIGSFLNVLTIRHGIRSLGGRSACMTCGTSLRWADLIPVVSWVALLGRCRFCGARISARYPLTEAATAAAFALIGGAPYPAPLFLRLLFCGAAALLIAIAVYDLYHTIIPDEWAYLFGMLALLGAALPLLLGGTSESLALRLAAGPIVALPLFLFWLFSGGRWMGLGDAKLALGIGWLLGPAYGLAALFLAFIIGGAVSAPLLFFSTPAGQRAALFIRTLLSAPRLGWQGSSSTLSPHGPMAIAAYGVTMKSEIAFGPFLAAGCFLAWFFLLYGVDPFGSGLLL